MLQNPGCAQDIIIVIFLRNSGYVTELSVCCRTQGMPRNLVYAAEVRVFPGYYYCYYQGMPQMQNPGYAQGIIIVIMLQNSGQDSGYAT